MLSLSPIGVVTAPEDGADPDAGPALITLDKRFAPALDGLAGFSHVVVLWWADRADGTERNELIQPLPYRGGPDQLGVFATRAPGRPNPIGLSVCRLLAVDPAACSIMLDYLDALPGTPVLDLKPYTPSLDRVEDPPCAELVCQLAAQPRGIRPVRLVHGVLVRGGACAAGPPLGTSPQGALCDSMSDSCIWHYCHVRIA